MVHNVDRGMHVTATKQEKALNLHSRSNKSNMACTRHLKMMIVEARDYISATIEGR